MALLPTCILAASLLAARGPAPHADADTLVAKGVELRRQKEDAEALEMFRRAHALAPTSRTLAQMGFAEVALRRWLDAEQHLADAIRAGDSYAAKNRKLIDQQLADARTHIGTLQISGPAGATVLLDGRSAGSLPLGTPIRLAEGPVNLSATAPGFAAPERKVIVEGGKEQTVVLVMSPAIATTGAERSPAEPRSGSRAGRWVAGGLAAVAVGGIAAGSVLLYLNGRTSCESKDGPACATVYTTRTPGLVTLGAGVVAGAAAGLVFWRSRETPVAIAPTPDGVAVAGSF